MGRGKGRTMNDAKATATTRTFSLNVETTIHPFGGGKISDPASRLATFLQRMRKKRGGASGIYPWMYRVERTYWERNHFGFRKAAGFPGCKSSTIICWHRGVILSYILLSYPRLLTPRFCRKFFDRSSAPQKTEETSSVELELQLPTEV